jgi:hypothetical protein
MRSGTGFARLRYLDAGEWHNAEDARAPVPINDGPRVIVKELNGDLLFILKGGMISYDGRAWGPLIRVPKAVDYAYSQLTVHLANEADADSARQLDESMSGGEKCAIGSTISL